ncbi:Bbp16 family capsid cement protein [Paraburkholderia atlantica]|uniref:Bbp16 family capsid cement protein n=1 Tax=Paraburkholderia atlantica TaxID=2654982 RepID=UPI003D1F5083
MILDQQTLFSDAQAITASANSSNVIDTLPGGQNTKSGIGDGQDISLFAQIGTAFATLTSLNIQLVSADDAALSTNAIVHFDSGAIPVASLTAKARPVALDLPYGKYRRYVGLKYVVTGSNATAGTITAGLVEDLQTLNGTVDYAKGYTAA